VTSFEVFLADEARTEIAATRTIERSQFSILDPRSSILDTRLQ